MGDQGCAFGKERICTMRPVQRVFAVTLSLTLMAIVVTGAEGEGMWDRFRVKDPLDTLKNEVSMDSMTDMLKHPMEFGENEPLVSSPAAETQISALEDAWSLPRSATAVSTGRTLSDNVHQIELQESEQNDEFSRLLSTTLPRKIPNKEQRVTPKSAILSTSNQKGCDCQSAEIKPVCAGGRNFPSPCLAKCNGHKSFAAGVCSTAKSNKTPVGANKAKKVPKLKKSLSKRCKKRLIRMKKWAARRIKKAHIKAQEALRFRHHAQKMKQHCDERHGTIVVSGHKSVDYCKLHDKFIKKARAASKKGLYHALKAEMWRARYKKKICFKTKVSSQQLVGKHNWGESGKRISLVWSEHFEKKYAMRWPHCTNIRCLGYAPRTVIELECQKDVRCTGFSFTADQRLGKGCMKNCFHDESFAGYGAISHDYWAKRTMKHRQIFGSMSGPMVYRNCFHNGADTLAWHGDTEVVTRPAPAVMAEIGWTSKAVSGVSVPPGWCVQIYEKPHFKGATIQFKGPKNVECLTGYRMSGTTSWMRNVASMKVFPNAACKIVPKKLKKKVLVKKKLPPPPQDKRLPEETPWYWEHHGQVGKKHHKQMKLLHSSAHAWKKKEIAHVLSNLEGHHLRDIHCHMGEPGCHKETKQVKKKAATKAAKTAPKKPVKVVPKKKLASNYMSLLLRSVYMKQAKKVRDQFKKPEAWCLHFHDECRTALHDKLIATKKQERKAAPATNLFTEHTKASTQLLALKQRVATANAAVAKAKRVLAISQARKHKKGAKENLNKYEPQA